LSEFEKMNSGRNTKIDGIKQLKAPQEGGTGADHEKWSEKLEAHTISWPAGKLVATMISTDEQVDLKEPEDPGDRSKMSYKEEIVFERDMKMFM